MKTVSSHKNKEMKKITLLVLSCSCFLMAQQNPYKIIQNTTGFDNNGLVDSQETPGTDITIASPINVVENNFKISGLNVTFNTIDLSEIDDFLITVYEDNSGVPGNVVFEEDIHKNNYYCNQVEVATDQFNIDFFLRNPIDLSTGNYWFTLVAQSSQTPTEAIQLQTVTNLGYATAIFNGMSWVAHNVDIAHKLYGVKNAPSIISTFPYTQNFGIESLDGWQMSDLFPEGILAFEIDNTFFSETDDNTSSVRMGSDYGAVVEMQLFYNLTSPKFRFEAEHTYRISTKIHHTAYDSGYRQAFIGIVYVPDPPELGFLLQIDGLNFDLTDIIPESNLNPTRDNAYFYASGL